MIRGIIFVCCLSFACLAVVSGETALYIKGVRAEWNPTPVIHETEVADLSAHLIKTIPLHNFINRENFPELSLNGHPQATVLTVMEAVTEKEASHMKFFAEENSFKKLEIATENPDLDPICRTTTLLSGELPESHRIVGHSWIDGTTAQTVKAFTYKGHSQVWRVADAVAQASNGNALTLAISADSALAGALALHNDLHDTHPTWNTEAFYYDNYASIGKSLFGIAGLIEFKDVVAYHAELEKAYPGMFTLHKNADTIFIAEMAMLRKLPSKVKFMHRENTGASDLISVGISSVLSLKNVYGTISKQVSVALEVIDNELQQLQKELNLFYGGNIIEEVAVLGGSTAIYTAEAPFEHVALRNILSVEEDGYEDPDNDTTYYTFAQVSSYQSCVWAGVIMLVSLVWASCFMYCMETGTDTLLFRGLGGKPHIQ